MGVVGLILGAFTANPLMAVAGLVGGLAAGTILLDGHKQEANSISHDSTPGSDAGRLAGNSDATQKAPSTDISRTFCHPPAPGTIALDTAFDACEPESPKPSG